MPARKRKYRESFILIALAAIFGLSVAGIGPFAKQGFDAFNSPVNNDFGALSLRE